ncbi:MAG: T9SS type A sorting domain-containing protein [Bacteroidia bacterium]
MKKIITTLSLFLMCIASSQAQITGDTVVCSGYTYTYDVAPVPNAAFYIWYFPNGWYDISGAGTNRTVTCNTIGGTIYCVTRKANGNYLSTITLGVRFGNGGIGGWNVHPAAITGCSSATFSLSVVPNGTGNGGTCPAGCGNGTAHPNIQFALYDDVWPSGQFIMYADGISTATVGANVGTAYVYQVDVTNGTAPGPAVMISGVCGNETINNAVNITNTGTCCSNTPTGLYVNQKTTTSAKLHWAALNPVPERYQLRYRITGTTTWTTVLGLGNATLRNITGLTPGGEYEWQLRARCGTTSPYTFSMWSALNTFTLPSVRIGDETPQMTLEVFPNPTTGLITLMIPDCDNCNYKLTMYNVVGKVVYTQQAINSSQQTLDFSYLTKGIYALSVEDGDRREMIKVVIE